LLDFISDPAIRALLVRLVLIAFSAQAAVSEERIAPFGREAGDRVPFWTFHCLAGYLSGQGVQNCVRIALWSPPQLAGGGFRRLRTSRVTLLSEVITLARALRGFAHREIKSRYVGFLMTLKGIVFG